MYRCTDKEIICVKNQNAAMSGTYILDTFSHTVQIGANSDDILYNAQSVECFNYDCKQTGTNYIIIIYKYYKNAYEKELGIYKYKMNSSTFKLELDEFLGKIQLNIVGGTSTINWKAPVLIDNVNDNLYIFHNRRRQFHILNLRTKNWTNEAHKCQFSQIPIWSKVYWLLMSMGLVSNPWFIAFLVSSFGCFVMSENSFVQNLVLLFAIDCLMIIYYAYFDIAELFTNWDYVYSFFSAAQNKIHLFSFNSSKTLLSQLTIDMNKNQCKANANKIVSGNEFEGKCVFVNALNYLFMFGYTLDDQIFYSDCNSLDKIKAFPTTFPHQKVSRAYFTVALGLNTIVFLFDNNRNIWCFDAMITKKIFKSNKKVYGNCKQPIISNGFVYFIALDTMSHRLEVIALLLSQIIPKQLLEIYNCYYKSVIQAYAVKFHCKQISNDACSIILSYYMV